MPMNRENAIDASTIGSWIYPTNYPLRDYQVNISQQALFSNTLVCLPTGLGKTLIAAVVIYNYYRWFPNGKIIFMAPTRPLVNQQLQACVDITHISSDHTIVLEGTIAVEKRESLWKAKRVIFCTPQAAMNDLIAGRLSAHSIVCVVIDEAHKATDSYAYTTFVNELYSIHQNFRVLALSATPGKDLRKINEVVRNLKITHIEVRTEDDPEIEPYTHEKQIEIIKCDEVSIPYPQQIREEINNLMQRPLREVHSHGLSLSSQPSLINAVVMNDMEENLKEFLQDGTISSQLEKPLRDALSFIRLLLNCRKVYQEEQAPGLLSFLDQKLRLIRSTSELCYQQLLKLHELVQHSNTSKAKSIEQRQPKIAKLKQILIQHFQDYHLQHHTEDTRVLVFVHLRTTVMELKRELAAVSGIRAREFIGQGKSEEGTGLSQAEQRQILQQFHRGVYNVLIATSIAEEGLDIAEVDLIVLFDSVASPTRLVQRCGRTGRKRAGRIVMITTGTDNNTSGLSGSTQPSSQSKGRTQTGEEDKLHHSYQAVQTLNEILKRANNTVNFWQYNPRMIPSSYPLPQKVYAEIAENGKPDFSSGSSSNMNTQSQPNQNNRQVNSQKNQHKEAEEDLFGFTFAQPAPAEKSNQITSYFSVNTATTTRASPERLKHPVPVPVPPTNRNHAQRPIEEKSQKGHLPPQKLPPSGVIDLIDITEEEEEEEDRTKEQRKAETARGPSNQSINSRVNNYSQPPPASSQVFKKLDLKHKHFNFDEDYCFDWTFDPLTKPSTTATSAPPPSIQPSNIPPVVSSNDTQKKGNNSIATTNSQQSQPSTTASQQQRRLTLITSVEELKKVNCLRKKIYSSLPAHSIPNKNDDFFTVDCLEYEEVNNMKEEEVKDFTSNNLLHDETLPLDYYWYDIEEEVPQKVSFQAEPEADKTTPIVKYQPNVNQGLDESTATVDYYSNRPHRHNHQKVAVEKEEEEEEVSFDCEFGEVKTVTKPARSQSSIPRSKLTQQPPAQRLRTDNNNSSYEHSVRVPCLPYKNQNKTSTASDITSSNQEEDKDLFCCICLKSSRPPHSTQSATVTLSSSEEEEGSSSERDDEAAETDRLITCTGKCGQTFHPDCYGLDLPSSSSDDDDDDDGEEDEEYASSRKRKKQQEIKCDYCLYRQKNRLAPTKTCALCFQSTGLLKQSTCNQWVHHVCVFFTDELTTEEDGRANNLSALDPARRHLKCGICRSKGGAVVQCRYGDCLEAFHPYCLFAAATARNKSETLYFNEEEEEEEKERKGQMIVYERKDGETIYDLYCANHMTQSFPTSNRRQKMIGWLYPIPTGGRPPKHPNSIVNQAEVDTPKLTYTPSPANRGCLTLTQAELLNTDEKHPLPSHRLLLRSKPPRKSPKRLKRNLSKEEQAVQQQQKKEQRRLRLQSRQNHLYSKQFHNPTVKNCFDLEAEVGEDVSSDDEDQREAARRLASHLIEDQAIVDSADEDNSDHSSDVLSGDFINDGPYTQPSPNSSFRQQYQTQDEYAMYLNINRQYFEQHSPQIDIPFGTAASSPNHHIDSIAQLVLRKHHQAYHRTDYRNNVYSVENTPHNEKKGQQQKPRGGNKKRGVTDMLTAATRDYGPKKSSNKRRKTKAHWSDKEEGSEEESGEEEVENLDEYDKSFVVDDDVVLYESDYHPSQSEREESPRLEEDSLLDGKDGSSQDLLLTQRETVGGEEEEERQSESEDLSSSLDISPLLDINTSTESIHDHQPLRQASPQKPPIRAAQVLKVSVVKPVAEETPVNDNEEDEEEEFIILQPSKAKPILPSLKP